MNNVKRVSAFKMKVGGKFFRVDFVKKTTGEQRRLIGRTQLSDPKFFRGGELAYDRDEKGIIWAGDFKILQEDPDPTHCHRSFYLDTVERFKIGGKEYTKEEFEDFLTPAESDVI